MEIALKIRVLSSEGEPFLGPGPVELLGRVDSCGSIQRAARKMEMSYMKALRLLNDLESCVGSEFVIRRTGGPGGGGAELTPFAREMIRAFEKLQSKVIAFASREFDQRDQARKNCPTPPWPASRKSGPWGRHGIF